MTRLIPHPIVVPPLGDRSVDCQLSQWVVALGDFVGEGEPVAILETEKTAVELSAPIGGILAEVFVYEGEEVIEAECLGLIHAEDFDDEDEESSLEADDPLDDESD